MSDLRELGERVERIEGIDDIEGIEGIEGERVERTVRRRLLTIVVLAAALISVILAVPGLRSVARDVRHVNASWLVLGGLLEVASCASFVVIFRRFFGGVPKRQARRLAWTEMGSGALLPGGGVGSLAVGGWLLHLAGMPTRKILRSSSGLFFLTTAVNVLALLGGALLLASGVSAGRHDLLRVGLPILGAVAATSAVLMLARRSRRHPSGLLASPWVEQLLSGVEEAWRAVARPSFRLLGALGYLGFDIAVLWATLRGVGYSSPIGVLLLGYILGYIANLLPVPGGVGVLEGGIAGTLALYGAPLTQATAGVLIYHAIAFWIPSLGGIIAYRWLKLELPQKPVERAPAPRHAPIRGERMKEPTMPAAAMSIVAEPTTLTAAAGPSLAERRDRVSLSARHIEGQAVAWLRGLHHDAIASSEVAAEHSPKEPAPLAA